jgi:tripartite-type tricarboxylate transporter receptor subunit TctC
MVRIAVYFAGLMLAALSTIAPALAEGEFPARPIKIVVGFGPGGGNDIFARLIAPKLSEILGQPVTIENRPGGLGKVSVAYVRSQPADGHTLLVGASNMMSIAAALQPDLPFHPTKSFIPLTMTASYPLVMVVPYASPAKTVRELAAWAKANPGKANYATTAAAFTLTTELLKLKSGMPGVAVNYRNSSEALRAVAGGQCLVAMVDGPPTVPAVRSGRVRPLAVTGAHRSVELPHVPSMAEAGFPEVDTRLWSGFFAHADTPPEISSKLEEALRAAIADAGVQERLKSLGVDPSGNTSEEFRETIEADIVKFADVAKAANLTFSE